MKAAATFKKNPYYIWLYKENKESCDQSQGKDVKRITDIQEHTMPPATLPKMQAV